MSIDARIKTVTVAEDGSGALHLIDRPKRPGGYAGIAGQKTLRFEGAPPEVAALNGRDIWGSSDSVMLGDVEIAKRVGYTRLKFCDPETFKRAVAADTAAAKRRAGT